MLTAANTDYIQATIEIFGTIITIVLAIIFFIITGNKKRSEKRLFLLLIVSGIALLVDGGWYLFDGNTTKHGIIINHVCNMMVFLCNPSIISLANSYIYNNIKEQEYPSKKRLTITAYVFAVIAGLMPVSNIIFKWMYYIDEHNIYHRLSGWYIYTICNGVAVIFIALFVFCHRKHLAIRRQVAMYIFVAAPYIGVALQSIRLGISFIQVAITLGILVIYFEYLAEWIRKEKLSPEMNDGKNRFWLIECIVVVMMVCISASIISCVVSVGNISTENSEQSTISLGYMVSETIDSTLSEPIDVSRTMAQSKILIDALTIGDIEETEVEEDMIEYLQRIKDEYGYQMVFVASEATKAYYTYNGLSRYMDIHKGSKDAWYGEFLERYIPYEPNIDYDKDNDMSMAVFVNTIVRDEDGNQIGVCGVGMSIESLMDIIATYERNYSLEVSLVNPDGLIQLDTDRNRIENDYVDNSYFNQIIFTDVYYSRNAAKAKITRYMDTLGWYLIVEDNNPDKINVLQIVWPSLIIFVMGIVLLIALTFLFGYREADRNRELLVSKTISETDGLTGLKNRYSIEQYIDNLTQDGVLGQVSVIMIDINGLKIINDNNGHDAGDKLIKGTTECMRQVFGDGSNIFRTGGDEFIVINSLSDEDIKARIIELRERADEWTKVHNIELALSIGAASSTMEPGKTIRELIKIADGHMYSDKRAYYTQTGKERRQ